MLQLKQSLGDLLRTDLQDRREDVRVAGKVELSVVQAHTRMQLWLRGCFPASWALAFATITTLSLPLSSLDLSGVVGGYTPLTSGGQNRACVSFLGTWPMYLACMNVIGLL